uniref:Uncharacterized protein LOC114343831 n=1 Tax=Diabrotica virgifera virgifera TaxID=50390 RepID=A0A6P7GLD7_DIAVI
MAAADKVRGLDILKKLCKGCSKNVKSGVCCAKCNSVYHSSCAERAKTCCSENITENFHAEKGDVNLTSTSIEEYSLKEENKLLRATIQDKNTIIVDKEVLIKLLNEKIVSLEEKMNQLQKDKQMDKKQPKGNKNNSLVVPQQSTLILTKQQEASADKHGQLQGNSTKINENVIQGQSKINEQVVSLEIMKTQTQLIMNDVLNINNDETIKPDDSRLTVKSSHENLVKQTQINNTTNQNAPSSSSKNQHMDGWETQRKRGFLKNKRPAPIQGKRNGTSNLKIAPSVSSYSWIFLSGLTDDSTAKDVQSYMLENGVQNSVIEKLRTKKKFISSFKIGVTQESVPTVLTPDFWPVGLYVSEFLNLKNLAPQ